MSGPRIDIFLFFANDKVATIFSSSSFTVQFAIANSTG
jgi:hypothetical protein